MTGPPDPNHDNPEPLPVVLPVFVRRIAHCDETVYSFSPLPQCGPQFIHVPFGWGLAIDPEWGAVLRHAVRTDLRTAGPAVALHLAITKQLGFKLA